MKKKKRTTVEVKISALARAKLSMDNLCPDVGMGMFPITAVLEVLEEYGLTKEDVDFDQILKEV